MRRRVSQLDTASTRGAGDRRTTESWSLLRQRGRLWRHPSTSGQPTWPPCRHPCPARARRSAAARPGALATTDGGQHRAQVGRRSAGISAGGVAWSNPTCWAGLAVGNLTKQPPCLYLDSFANPGKDPARDHRPVHGSPLRSIQGADLHLCPPRSSSHPPINTRDARRVGSPLNCQRAGQVMALVRRPKYQLSSKTTARARMPMKTGCSYPSMTL